MEIEIGAVVVEHGKSILDGRHTSSYPFRSFINQARGELNIHITLEPFFRCIFGLSSLTMLHCLVVMHG